MIFSSPWLIFPLTPDHILSWNFACFHWPLSLPKMFQSSVSKNNKSSPHPAIKPFLPFISKISKGAAYTQRFYFLTFMTLVRLYTGLFCYCFGIVQIARFIGLCLLQFPFHWPHYFNTAYSVFIKILSWYFFLVLHCCVHTYKTSRSLFFLILHI